MKGDLYLQGLQIDWSAVPKHSYVRQIPAVKNISDITFESAVTFLVGENGTGKSTLLEAIAVAYGFNAEGGSKNFTFSTNTTHSELFRYVRLIKRGFAKDGFFLRAESLYNVATNIDYMDTLPSFDPPLIEGYGGVSLHRQSHGESFLSIVQNRFFGNGVYILDEPEAALSPMRLLSLMAEMNELVSKHSQFIIATHSPILMAFPNATILELTDDGLKKVRYQDTEHVRLTKHFLENPERMLHHLLNRDDD